MTLETSTLTLHGRRIRLREYRPGPPGDTVIVLLHGIAGCGRTWAPVLDWCERTAFGHRVLVPDLPGHGESECPRADYGLGALASVVRDVLALSGVRHATVAGHFASAGLGPEVSPVLRAAALPGARAFLALSVNRTTLRIGRRLGRSLKTETRELARHFGSLADPGRRRAFLSIARSLIDLRGQRASAADKLYLAEGVPILLVWGERDPLIPVTHGRRTAELLPEAHLAVLENAKHFPHVADPDRFCLLLNEFLDRTEPARLCLDDVVARLVAANPVHSPR